MTRQELAKLARKKLGDYLKAARPELLITAGTEDGSDLRDFLKAIGAVIELCQVDIKRPPKDPPRTGRTPPEDPAKGAIGVCVSEREPASRRKRVGEVPIATKSRQVLPEPGFEKFWEVWPNKVARQQAIKAWNDLIVEDRRIAYKAVLKRVERDVKWHKLLRDKEFKLHPATYLNGRRFEDEWEASESPVSGSAEPIYDPYTCPCGVVSNGSLAHTQHLDAEHDGREPTI